MSDVAISYRREASAAARWIVDQVRSRLREHMATHEIDTLEFELLKWLKGCAEFKRSSGINRHVITGDDMEMVFSDEIGDPAAMVLRTIAYVIVEPGRVVGKVIGSRWVEVYRRETP